MQGTINEMNTTINLSTSEYFPQTANMPGFSDLGPSEQSDHLERNGYVSYPYHASIQNAHLIPILDMILANYGGTFQATLNRAKDELYVTPVDFTDGYLVSLQGFEKVLPRNKELDVRELLKYIVNCHNFQTESTYFGAWYDSKTNQWYLDLSVHVHNLDDTVNMAYDGNQEAIWDCKNRTSMYTGKHTTAVNS